MSRNDREDVSHLDLPDPATSTANYYMEDGAYVDRDSYLQTHEPPNVLAKEVKNKETGVTLYYILCNNRSRMFDPRVVEPRYQKSSDWKFRKVVRTTFDLYIKFLRTNYSSLLLQAERNL